MNLLFRFDCDETSGSGHFRRSSLIAREFRKRGYTCTAACRLINEPFKTLIFDNFDEYLINFEREEDITVHLTNTDRNFEAVIFDNYELSARDHAKYRNFSDLLVGIEDCPSRQLDLDVIFDPNFRQFNEYENFVSDKTRFHAGAECQIISNLYYQQNADFEVSFKDIFDCSSVCYLSLGGYDYHGLLKKLVEGLSKLYPEIKLLIPDTESQFSYLRSYSNCYLLSDEKQMVWAVKKCTFGIGAAGTMTWERNSAFLPTAHLVLADNQLRVAKDMQLLTESPYITLDAIKSYYELNKFLKNFIDNEILRQDIRLNLQKLNKPTGLNFIPAQIEKYVGRNTC